MAMIDGVARRHWRWAVLSAADQCEKWAEERERFSKRERMESRAVEFIDDQAQALRVIAGKLREILAKETF